MKSKATSCGSISTVISSIVLLCVSSIIIIIITIIIIIIIIKDIEVNHNNNTGKRFYQDEEHMYENEATQVDTENFGGGGAEDHDTGYIRFNEGQQSSRTKMI